LVGAADLGADMAPDAAGALDLLGDARSRVESSEDQALTILAPRLAEVITILTDVSSDLTGYLEDLPSDPGALDTLLSRQAELKTLTRKYAADVDGVLDWAAQARERLGRIDVSADALAALAARVDEAAAALSVAADALSRARIKAAAKLGKAVSA